MADTVSITQLCSILPGRGREPFTRNTISTFVKDGMPKAARGRFDALACTTWYIDRLRTSNQKRTTDGDDGKRVSLDEAEIRLKLAKAELEEMNLRERRGEMIPLYLYEQEMGRLIVLTKQRLLNIPSRLVPKLRDASPLEMKALVAASIREALSDLARAGQKQETEPAKVKKKVPAKKKNVVSRHIVE